ncbi:hypothetical protein MJL79_28660, partial [Salmonella enterica subsp. enterica serovar Montevideo]|nr:hypothetical protein [Salmonella enterica subsp. enterica serovar Montevideo]
LSALTDANEIIVMQHGHVVQRGDHDQLAQQIGWYRDMYRYQHLIFRLAFTVSEYHALRL